MKPLFIFASVIGITLSIWLIPGWYLEYRYGIDDSISQEKVEHLYGALLDRLEEIYELEYEDAIREEVAAMRNALPGDLGILRLAQRDKGISYTSYGALYFSYSQEHYTQSYFYTNGQIRRVPDSIRGYVEARDGRRTDAIKYRRIVEVDGEALDIELIVDYHRLVGLARAL